MMKARAIVPSRGLRTPGVACEGAVDAARGALGCGKRCAPGVLQARITPVLFSLACALALSACAGGGTETSVEQGASEQAASGEAREAAPVSDREFDFQAHRGGRDARPENTLYSYAYAIENGATTIECDMQMTKDGHIVMNHNPFLGPETARRPDGTYLAEGEEVDIRTMTLEEVKSYNVAAINPETEYYKIHGETQVNPETAEIPTLEELFQLLRETGSPAKLNIETKLYPDPEDPNHVNNLDSKAFVEEFYRLVKEYGMEDRVTLESFDWQSLVEMKKLDPKIPVSALYSEQPSWGRQGQILRPYEDGASPYLAGLDIDDFHGDPVEAAHSLGINILSPYYTEISMDMLSRAHSLGMKVVPWSVNNATDMAVLFDMGNDGIITDRPWILREFLEERGVALNPRLTLPNADLHLEPDHQETDESQRAEGGMDAAY